MKIEEKIKNKFLYKPGFNLIKMLYFKIQTLKKKSISKTYCPGAQDLLINYFFKSKKKVFTLMLVVIILFLEIIQSFFMTKDGQESILI